MHPAGREGTEQPWQQQQQHPHHQGKLLSASWVLLGLPAACHNPAVPTKYQTNLGVLCAALGMWRGCCLCCGAGGSPEGTWGKERRQKCSKEEISSASTIRKLHNEAAALVLGCGSSLGVEYPSAFPEKSPSTGGRTSKMLVWGCLVLWRGPVMPWAGHSCP